MKNIHVITDIKECGEIWKQVVPKEHLSDLWEVRECFQNQYRHKPYFIIHEDRNVINGFLPLSKNEDTGNFVCFPGETWSGKTWLEQNRLIAKDNNVLQSMMKMVKGSYNLRYLQPVDWINEEDKVVDEIGYFFLPPNYDYKIEQYHTEFSGKSIKRLKKELESFESRNIEYVYDNDSDFETLVLLNLNRYGEYSYFGDTKFLKSFYSLVKLLRDNNWLRMTTIIIDGQTAAVDMGCVYGSTYTLLAGGTNAEFPGVAKLINMHHMKWACEHKLGRVDFLCGDFNWKTQFHLTPHPLYQLTGHKEKAVKSRSQSVSEWLTPQPGYSAGSMSNA